MLIPSLRLSNANPLRWALRWGPPAAAIVAGSPPQFCTLCHGWSEPGAAVKSYQPKFCTAPGPSGPEKIKTGNRILRAGTPAEGYRGIPRKRGSGGGPAGAIRRPRDTPGDPLVSFPSLGKKLAPQGETPVRRRAESSRPTDVMVCGGRAGQCPAPAA